MKTYPTKALIILRTTIFVVVFLFIFCLGFSTNVNNSVQAATYHWCCFGAGCTSGACLADTGALCINGDTYNEHECCIWTTAVCDSGLCLDGACYNGTMYLMASSVNTSDASSDKEVASDMGGTMSAKWYDQDFNGDLTGLEAYAGDFCQSPNVWFNLRSGCKSAGPGSICSDYNSENGFCCGDDANEKSVTSCSGTPNAACCPSTASYYNELTSTCVASCPVQTCGDNNGRYISGTELDYNQSQCVDPNGISGWALTNGNSSSLCWKNTMCCYDDSNEELEYRRGQNPTPPSASGWDRVPFPNDNSDVACCSPDGSCVYEGTCYPPDNSKGYQLGGYAETIYCYGSLWRDPDTTMWAGGACDLLGFHFTESGESSVGEYTTLVPDECCGDDPNEYYADLCPGVTDKDRACCNSSGDKIDNLGKCVAVCPCMIPPLAPTNLTHSNTTNSLAWSWTAPAAGCSSIVSYKVYGRKYDEADFTLLDTVASTSYTWSGLLANTKYEVKVAAVDANGRLGAFVGPAGFYTSIEQPEINCSNETINSVRLETVGAVTPPAPSSVTYDLKSNFAKTGVYYGWQIASQKDVTGLSSATAYVFSLKTRNGDGDENTPTTKTCSTLSNLSVDLIIDSIVAPDYVCQDGSVNADVITKNIGNTSSGQTSKTKVFIDSDDSGAGGIATLMDTWVDSLNPGIEQTKTTDAWNTGGVSIGNHQIVAIADAPADSRINESNESNNVLRKTIEVRACVPVPGSEDFDLVTPSIDATGVSLNPTTFSWSALSGAISYHLYLCPSVDSNWANCSSPVQIVNLATISYTTTTLAANTGYLWQVTATTPSLTKAAKNGPRHFTTATTALASVGPTANFTFCKYSADTLQFNDISSAGDSAIRTWSWNFGDSETCTISGNCTETGYPGTNQHPIHTFVSSEPQVVVSSGSYWSGSLDAPPIPGGGSLGGTPSYVPGKIGNGLEFNSSTEWLEVVMTESMKDRGFITFWYKPYYNSSNNSTNYLMEASADESLLQLVHTNTGGLYFKVEAPGRSATLTLVNTTDYSWTANQWVLLGVGWDLPSRKITISVNGVDHNFTTGSYSSSLEFTSSDKLRFGSAIGSSGQGAFTSNGVFDDVKIYTTYTHTSTPGGYTSFNITLTVADAEGDSDSEQKVVDVSTAPSCAYNLTNVAPNNCNSIGLAWGSPISCTPDYYYIYRSSDGGGTWNLLQTQPGSSTIFDDNTVKENSAYSYYLSTSPPEIAYNNSTLNPVCSGGFGTGGTKCSLSATTPLCGISGSSTVTLSHSCGKITASWPKDANAKLYQLQRSYGANVEDKYVNIATIYPTDTIRCPSSSTDCFYVDNRIVPVNIVNPPAAKKYWYRLREQRNDNSWSNWSTGVEDYSYCYRAPNWQEE